MMLNVAYVYLVLIFQISFCQNDTNNAGKRYFFKMGKQNNELKVNNRIYFLNHNITDYDYTHKGVDRLAVAVPNTKVKVVNNSFQNNVNYLDEEWNFDHKNLTKRQLPLFVHKLYENQNKGENQSTTTSRILFNCNRNNSSRIIFLNLNSLNPNETVLDAELYFFWPLEETSKIYRESVVLRLYQYEKHKNTIVNASNPENPDIHKLFNVIYISKAHRGWQTFKIKKPIDNWLNGEENLGLLLTISSYDSNTLISIFNDTNHGIYSTFAIVTVKTKDTMNNKYDTLDHDFHGSSAYCQRKQWNVSFKSLNWDNFIITPDGFTAYDCAGKCSKSQANKANNHLKLLNIFSKRSPCCVPTKYLPLPIMFYDKYGNVVIKNYHNMIVSECGCR